MLSNKYKDQKSMFRNFLCCRHRTYCIDEFSQTNRPVSVVNARCLELESFLFTGNQRDELCMGIKFDVR